MAFGGGRYQCPGRQALYCFYTEHCSVGPTIFIKSSRVLVTTSTTSF